MPTRLLGGCDVAEMAGGKGQEEHGEGAHAGMQGTAREASNL
jgi:hypothetical protein